MRVPCTQYFIQELELRLPRTRECLTVRNSHPERSLFRGKLTLVPMRLDCILFSLQNMEYVIVSGATRKEERWDSKDTETVEATGMWSFLDSSSASTCDASVLSGTSGLLSSTCLFCQRTNEEQCVQ